MKIYKSFFEETKHIIPVLELRLVWFLYHDNLNVFGEISINLIFKDGLDAFLGISIGLRAYL